MLARGGGGYIVVAILLGLVVGLGAFTFGYGKGFSYLQDDPAACANCHVMQDHFASWERSSHHDVATCNSCHLPHNFVGKWWVKSDNGFFHSLAFTTGQFHDPIQIKPRNRRVTQNACLHCHQATVHEMLPAPEATAQAGGAMLQCIACHADVGHAGRRRGSIGFPPQDRVSASGAQGQGDAWPFVAQGLSSEVAERLMQHAAAGRKVSRE